MANCTCKYDFRDFDKALRDFCRQVRTKVQEVGEEAVDYAVKNGTYHDVTGRLRSSNKYEVDANANLTISNDAPYAAEVEAKGKDVIGGAALFAEQRLKEIFE